ncbi:MAG: hypothetical protein GJ680_01460 [Alteromonadaceae bacterium]|nr:hypothetical protein [Alteromonadaceae bacterium]
MRLTLALYWRTQLAIILLICCGAFAQTAINFLGLVSNNYAPSLFWSVLALIFLVSALIHKNGLAYLFFGARLALASEVWHKLNRLNFSFFLVLALTAVLVVLSSSRELWSMYKLYGQPLMLLGLPYLYISKLIKIKASRPETTVKH